MCAVFNPQIQPTQDPNYLNYSKVVDAPSPNQSSGLLVKALGEGLEGAVSVIDTNIKEAIKNKVYKSVDPLRDEMTAGLEKVKAQVTNAGNQTPAPVQKVAGGTTGSWLDSNAMMDAEDSVPDGLSQGLDRVKLLTQARAAAKINDTQYSGEVLAVAKQLRNTYGPGYREYIDQHISAASGLPVANAYYQNLMLDINRQLSQVAQKKDGVEALVMKNLEVPNIVAFFQQYKAGTMGEATIIQKIADHQRMMNQFQIDGAKRAETAEGRAVAGEGRAVAAEGRTVATYNKKDRVDTTTDSFTKTTNDFVTNSMSDIVSLSGMNKAEDLVRYFEDVSAGRVKQTDEQVNQRRAELTAFINEKERSMWALATQGGSNSVAATIGNEPAKLIIKNALYPLQTTADMAGSKENGPAFYNARAVEAIKADSALGFLINKDTSAASRQLMGARAVIGEQYFPDFIKNFVENNVDLKYKSLFEQEALSAIQPIVDSRGAPLPRSMKEAIEHGKAIGAPSESGLYGGLTSIPNKITDPKLSAPAKDRIIDWAFDPSKNKGVLDHLKPDYIDPATNTLVPGKHSAFNTLVSPAMVQSIAESAKVKPENYTKFLTTVEGEFSTILRTDVQDINKVALKVPGTHYGWDDKANRLYLLDQYGKPVVRNERYQGITNPNGVYLNGVIDKLDRLNEGLGKLSYAQANNPNGVKDTSLYVYNVLKDNNANVEILKAIINSRNPPKETK